MGIRSGVIWNSVMEPGTMISLEGGHTGELRRLRCMSGSIPKNLDGELVGVYCSRGRWMFKTWAW